ncbi:maleylpyruvate isomerase family mycothiol-dependent enzyme [Actinacidiphila rubida]|uniref:TIGR03083 family protein n=1 Tax=Actinacidiphila rubida TaxID=310780 RepID=A0A1H8FEU9_9ACTN|nr:maleylpyruvate isomerase family mycothiol-dependent enzyme [Actinacidiphila rubida]SEN30110.1 TIGR03083 family protein [Actinacidiphila rubida]
MAPLDHERYCAAVIAETTALREALHGADLARQVPTCPDWTLHELAAHVGQAHRWADAMVRARASDELPDDAAHVPGYEPGPGAAALDTWLADGAAALAAALRAAGPEAPVWTWAGPHRAGFWARRMAVETLVHRADAALTAGRPYVTDGDLAADGIDEWLGLLSDPEQAAKDPDLAGLLGVGRTLHLHATDVPGAEWLVTGGPGHVEVRREHTKADVAVRGTLTDLLLVMQRRLPADSDRLALFGDRTLFDHWLDRTRWG